MRRPPTPDCYDYVRRYYGVPAYVGMRVRVREREGVLVQGRGRSDQYLHIRFDGEDKTSGPYHPTDGITYLLVSTEPNGTPARSVAVGQPASDTPGDITRAPNSSSSFRLRRRES